MFSKAAFLITLILLSMVQITLLPQFFPAGCVPNLVLIVVVYWTIRSGFNESWKKVVLAGFILDLSYGWAIGINILSLSTVSFMVGYFTKRVSAEQRGWGFLIILGLVALGTIVNSIIAGVLIKTVAELKSMPLENAMVDFSALTTIWSALLASISFVFLYQPMEKFEKFLASYQGDRFVKTRFLK